MNGKVNKQQIQFPPLLNLANDRPHIDSTFKNWEKNNAPYLNDMISPTYIKENGTAGIYDNKGRKHQIIDGTWYIDGVAKNSGYNYKFNRTVLGSNYLTYDFNNSNELVYVWYDNYYIRSNLGSSLEVADLVSESDIVDIRCRFIETSLLVVMLYRTGSGLLKVFAGEYFNNGHATLRVNEAAIWSQQTITSGTPTTVNDVNDPGSIDPIINICKVNGHWGFSVFSNYGEAVNSRYNYYITYYGFTRIASFTFPSQASYMKKVWYKGMYTASASRQIIPDPTRMSEVARWSETQSFRYAHIWIHVDPSEVSEAGLNSGFYPVYDCNREAVYSQNGIAAITWVNVDTSNGYANLPYPMQFDGYPDATAEIRDLNGTRVGSVNGLWVMSTLSDEDHDARALTIIPSVTANTDANTLINSEDLAVRFRFEMEEYDIFVVPESTNMTTDVYSDYMIVSTSVALGNSKNNGRIRFVHSTNEFWWDFVDVTFTTPDGTIYKNTTAAYIDYITRQATTLSTSNLFCVPNVFLDNGNIYNIAAFQQSTTSLVLMDNTAGVLCGSGPYAESGSILTISTINEMIDLNDSGVNGKWTIRSNSFICQQNYIAQMYKFTLGTISPANLTAGNAESTGAYNIEVYNSNVTDLKIQPGSSRYTGFNYYGDFLYKGSTTGSPEDRLVYCTIGARSKINPSDGSNCFNMLLNTTTDNTCYFQGVSWANGDDIGTLLSPWQEVSEDFYIVSKGNKCLYKNKYDELILIERVAGSYLTPVNNNKFIICNTDNYWNMFDSERGQWFHYASDWNFRILGGYEGLRTLSASESVSNTHRMYFADAYTFWFRNIGASVNNTIARTASRTNFSNPNIYPVASWQTPVYAKARIYVDELSLYGANEPSFGDAELLGIDVYYTKYPNVTTSGIGDAYYQYTYISGNQKFKSNLNGVTYVITSSSTMFLNPSLLATYLDGAGNNDLIRDLKEYYTQNYYNNKPTFIYAVSSEVNGADAFFVIQGQFYAIIENKICSVGYTDSVLTSKDPIIDINGMKFLGNNPMIAFFWSDRYKSFYSFTGDASLEHLYNGSKFINGINGDHYYDYSTQTIYVPTSRGLLCFGPKNTYILERFKDTTNVQFTDDNITHITDSGNDYSLVYYPEDGYQVYNVDLESSFYGIGSTESTTIDRWNITLYDPEGTHPTGVVKYGVRSITDITVKSEDVELKITPDMWDKWSNAKLVAYNPKLIKGQGIKLYVNSPFIIQQITAHVMDNGTGTPVNNRASV